MKRSKLGAQLLRGAIPFVPLINMILAVGVNGADIASRRPGIAIVGTSPFVVCDSGSNVGFDALKRDVANEFGFDPVNSGGPAPKDLSGLMDEERDRLLRRAGWPVGGVVLEAEVVPGDPKTGGRALLVLSVRNLNDRTIPFVYFGAPWRLLVRDAHNKPLAWKEAAIKMWGEVPFSFSGSYLWRIQSIPPAHAIGITVPLDRYFSIDAPGKYTVLPTCDFTSSDLVAKPVAFEIAKRGATSRIANATMVLEATLSGTNPTQAALAVSLKRAGAEKEIDPEEWQMYPRDDHKRSDGEIAVEAGSRFSDYQVVVRDLSGNIVPMTAAGRAWTMRQREALARNLGPGQAIGFVFPLRNLFLLQPGKSYTCTATLPGTGKNSIPLSAKPVPIAVPALELAGVNRPRYGSAEMWNTLASRLRDSRELVAATSQVGFEGDSVLLKSEVRNASKETVRCEGRLCDDVILVRRADGSPVPSNGNRNVYGTAWSINGYDVVLAPEKSCIRGRCPIGLIFDLRAGERYSILWAANFVGRLGPADRAMSTQTVLVGKPVTFSMRGNEKASSEPAGRATQPVEAGSSDADPEKRWDELSKFAGQAYRGLRIDSRITAESRVIVTVRNVAKTPIHITKWRDYPGFDIMVRDSSGKLVDLTAEGSKFFAKNLLETCVLEPGETSLAGFDIEKLFMTKNSGEYTVLASVPVVGDVDAVLTAAPLKIRINPKPATPGK